VVGIVEILSAAKFVEAEVIWSFVSKRARCVSCLLSLLCLLLDAELRMLTRDS